MEQGGSFRRGDAQEQSLDGSLEHTGLRWPAHLYELRQQRRDRDDRIVDDRRTTLADQSYGLSDPPRLWIVARVVWRSGLGVGRYEGRRRDCSAKARDGQACLET